MFIASIMIFISLNRHSKTGIFFYRSQIYGDKAGYYVYLPATILYQMDPMLFPKDVDKKTGHGFLLNTDENIVHTKYTYGVALFQLPFFLIAHTLANHLDFESNGFSLIYHWAIDISAIFYFLIGLYFLNLLLRQLFSKKTVLLSIIFMILSTNLYYYAFIETGMSHVYSFFLFSIVLYLLFNWRTFINKPILYGILLGFLFSLILVIRPSNIVFVIAVLFINKDYLQRLKIMQNPYFLVSLVIIAFLFFLPQLIYWNYATGSFLSYSYGNESFSNWNSPKIFEVLLAPENGHILYNPTMLIIFAGILLMIKKRIANGYLILFVGIIVTYITASWWSYSFGCGYSCRNMVEYYSLFCIPLACIIEENKNKLSGYFLIGALILFSLYNLKMIYSYGGCWFGDGNWDWNEYFRWLQVFPS